jgi:release factor glutamine methyltransferase
MKGADEAFWNLRGALVAARQALTRAGADSPGLSAEMLLAESLGMERADMLKELLLHPDRELTKAQHSLFREYTARRAAGEPAAYILGRKEFYGRTFRVTRDTLIPRPETELLVESVLAAVREQAGQFFFADLGAGSGCIAVVLALELPESRGLAVDNSAAALAVARENARRLGAANLACIRADFTRPFLTDASLDCIVSNPPYLSAGEYRELGREARDFEPATALTPEDGSAAGMEHVAAVTRAAEQALRPGGRFFVEIGWEQGGAALSLVSSDQWKEASVLRDLAGRDRVLAARRSW